MRFWYYWHIQRHLTVDAVQWRLAWWVPRKIALYVFIRVYACTGDGPDDSYSRIYKAWEDGAGR